MSAEAMLIPDRPKKVRQCGHPSWQQCDCHITILGPRERVRLAINSLADAFSKWGHGLPHDSTCTVYEMGLCYCSVHSAMKELDQRYREMIEAIDAVYDEAAN
jgi:hypothetical protein